MTRMLCAIVSWALGALGALHMAATFRFFDAPSTNALWFFSGGALMALCAAVNLLNRAYGQSASGLRSVCVVANLLVTGIAVVGGILGRATAVESTRQTPTIVRGDPT